MGTNTTEMTESSSLLLRYRRLVSVVVHLALFIVAQAGAFALRFEFSIPADYLPLATVWLAVSLGIHLAVFAVFGMFSGMWR